MPEYLAPGVYVEEIDTGSKPIEGVSTSTAGMVGVTERGPVNIPILVTSFGEYQRWFGGYLNGEVFGDHRYLPHAVEGFFTNSGKRVFIVRVLDLNAVASREIFYDRGTPDNVNVVDIQLLRRAARGATSIYVLNNQAGLSALPRPTLRIGDGADAEYRRVLAAPGAPNHIVLRLPLAAPHAAAVPVNRLSPAPAAVGAALSLATNASSGGRQIQLNNSATVAVGNLLRIGVVNVDDEYIFVDGVNPATNDVTLRQPLILDHPSGGVVQAVGPVTRVNATTLEGDVLSSDSVAFVPVADRAPYVPGQLVEIGAAPNNEVRMIGQLGTADLGIEAYREYPVQSLAAGVTLVDAPAPNNDKALTADAGLYSTVIELTDRQNLNVGDVIRIGSNVDPNAETILIRSLPSRGASPDAGRVLLGAPLRRPHPLSGTTVRRQDVTAVAPGITALILPTDENGSRLTLAGSNGFAVNTVVQIRVPTGDVYFHRLSSAPATLAAVPVTLDTALQAPHGTGTTVVNRNSLLEVHALDPGEWGNRLRIAVQDQDPPLLRTQIRNVVDATHIRLNSISGLEVGSVVQRVNATGGLVQPSAKVLQIDRLSDNLLTIDTALPAVAIGDQVQSLEFQMNVFLLRQPDLVVNTRSESVLDGESFRYLSMDPRHSRYVEKVIGTTWVAGAVADEGRPPAPLRLEDRRSQGESRYIRIYDLGKDAVGPGEPDLTLERIRIGPEALTEVIPGGRERPARRALTEGDDLATAIADGTYVGIDDPEPVQRTGLFALRNEEEISIVACPGSTRLAVQNALINHCELMRYRFAVLDARRSPNDSLNDVQDQRQQFDTKYAALYHPWPLIPDPFPTNLAEVPDYPIPPSGHVMGIYARTDIERGVHKAPANEIVRGVIGLQRLLNKGEQDILNPFPVNINVIRDFRPNNRGIRVWGGRVITSDPDWKYVNVRRLLIFIEASIDRGLQWVVFEPNAEALWARVHRTASNFLTSVWRDGALEGTKPEEAYFVKVDRTTMTQTDIDNGKLIVLIGVAPVKPAEFVIIRIGLWTAHADT